jgi:hypothetical protein
VDILAALRVAQEFDVRIVLDGAAEAHLLLDEIKAAGVPVIVHPTMARAGGETENLTQEAAAILRRAGIPTILQSGFESYVPKTRVVLFEAALAAARGLRFDEALAAITIDAARLLGVGGRVGSLEAGKDADLALFDGDPFEYTTHVVGVVIDGEVVSETVRYWPRSAGSEGWHATCTLASQSGASQGRSPEGDGDGCAQRDRRGQHEERDAAARVPGSRARIGRRFGARRAARGRCRPSSVGTPLHSQRATSSTRLVARARCPCAGVLPVGRDQPCKNVTARQALGHAV